MMKRDRDDEPEVGELAAGRAPVVRSKEVVGRKDAPPRAPQTGVEELRSTRSRTGRLMGVQIVGTGSSVPPKLVRNEDLAKLGYDSDWIVQRSGILQRYHVEPGTATSDLAVEAAERCIENAGVDREDIDLLLLGTYTPDMPLPSTACLVQGRLGICAPAVDMHAACASFAYALLTGMQFVATGCSRLALVIGADCNSLAANPADKRVYPLFGDAAGAVLVAPGSKDQGLLSYAAGSDGLGADLLNRPVGGTRSPFTKATPDDPRLFLQMEGRPIYKWAIRLLRDNVAETLDVAEVTLDEVDLFIFHQANIRIINSAVKDIGIDPAKVFNNIDRYGNTSSASIPLALDEAHQQGLVKPGNLILFSGFGAGLAWATTLMRW